MPLRAKKVSADLMLWFAEMLLDAKWIHLKQIYPSRESHSHRFGPCLLELLGLNQWERVLRCWRR